MKHPPYHLRPNKAIDRFMLIDVIKRLISNGKYDEYTYYSLGGPYLEDFRLLYEFFPEIKMISIEENEETFKRQQFHLPCGTLKLINDNIKSYLELYESNDEKSIFWLDYTDLEWSAFDDFMMLLGKMADNSVIKVTLPSDPNFYYNKDEGKAKILHDEFAKTFGEVLPDPSKPPPFNFEEFAFLLQNMIQIASQKAIPSITGRTLQPISSFYYADGAKMFTFTGMVCSKDDLTKIRDCYLRWPFRNLDWGKPTSIDLPSLSTKERLYLQERWTPYFGHSVKVDIQII